MQTDIDKIAVSSGDRFFGASTAYGYQTSIWLGSLRLHVFHREDPGEAFHNHPWDFWTFPLTSYVERVLDPVTGRTWHQVVPAFRISFRRAEHAHRVLGRAWWDGGLRVRRGAVITLCWRGRHRRDWHYALLRDGRVRLFPWRRYLAKADGTPR